MAHKSMYVNKYVRLATSTKPLSSKISFRVVRVPVHFNVN